MMFRFLAALVVIGVAIYKTLYGGDEAEEAPLPQHTEQPVGISVPVMVIRTQAPPKPEVLWGDPLTDEEWSMIQNADHGYLN